MKADVRHMPALSSTDADILSTCSCLKRDYRMVRLKESLGYCLMDFLEQGGRHRCWLSLQIPSLLSTCLCDQR